MSRLRKHCFVGIVSGSDLVKVSDQLAFTPDDNSAHMLSLLTHNIGVYCRDIYRCSVLNLLYYELLILYTVVNKIFIAILCTAMNFSMSLQSSGNTTMCSVRTASSRIRMESFSVKW